MSGGMAWRHHRVTGGSCPPPVPTERGVRFLLRCTFGVPHHALRQVVHSTLLLYVPGSFPRSASSSLCIARPVGRNQRRLSRGGPDLTWRARISTLTIK